MIPAIVSVLAAFTAMGCIVTGAHCADPVHAAEAWLRRQFAHGVHDGPDLPGFGEPEPGTQAYADKYASRTVQRELLGLPDDTPADWTPLLTDTVDDVRRRHGRHERTTPRRVPAWQQVTPVEAPGHAPWSASMPLLAEDAAMSAEADRAAYVRSHLRDAATARDPGTLQRVLSALRGGLSFDCGNGLHAPVCDGRNCSCSCHAARVYGEAPVLAVEQAQRLAGGLIA